MEGRPTGANGNGAPKGKSTGFIPLWKRPKAAPASESPEEAGVTAAAAVTSPSTPSPKRPPTPTSTSRRTGSSCCICAKYFCVTLLGVVVAITVISSILLWFTTSFEDAIHKGMVFREGSSLLEGWKRPGVKPYLRIYVYNYTNTERFDDGIDAKLKVQEVGPYTYREVLERVSVTFNSNGTMSYRERRTHEFLPHLSKGKEDDLLIVPNLPLISAIRRVRNDSAAARLSLSVILWSQSAKPFAELKARDYFFGYEDSLYNVAKAYSSFVENKNIPKLGLLASRSGVSNDTYTVFTGVENFTLLDIVNRHNGRPALTAWSDPKCNRIDGSEGTFFSSAAVAAKKRVFLFNGGICRRLPLEFKKEVLLFGNIPALKYGPPDTVFHSTTENACYKSMSNVPSVPSGIFDNSACAHGSPVMLSFPRFYLGSPQLREYVDGIPEPKREENEFYFYIHPVLGMNMGAVSRMQMNIMVHLAAGVNYLGSLKDGDVLPIVWIETNATEFPDDTKEALFHATYTVRTVERGLMYALPVLGILAALSALWIAIPCKPAKEEYEPELDTMLKSPVVSAS